MVNLRTAIGRRGVLAGAAAVSGAVVAKLLGAQRAEATHSPGTGTAGADSIALHVGQINPTSVATELNRTNNVIATTLRVSNNFGSAFRGDAAGGVGVYGTDSLAGTGVRGESATGVAVIGTLTGATNGNAGVSGSTGSSTQTNAIGVLGSSTVGIGVKGSSGSSSGVQGESTSGAGVFGLATNNAAVFGTSPFAGVAGLSSNNAGAQGTSTNGAGVFGTSTNNAGVFGTSPVIAVWGQTTTGTGVFGQATGAGGFAGQFAGNVFINGSLTVTGSVPKSAAVKRKDGSLARMYCQESPEPWFEDFGTTQLQNGGATVDLSADFDEVVDGNDYRVFLTAIGDTGFLYVNRKGPHRFEVRSHDGAAAKGSFDYRVVARRKDLTNGRMERVDAPKVPEPQQPPHALTVDELPKPPASSGQHASSASGDR